MTYGELKPLICGTSVIAFDSCNNKMLFDTLTSRKGKDKKYRNRIIIGIWAGGKKRTNSGFPLTDTEETVICVYLARNQSEYEITALGSAHWILNHDEGTCTCSLCRTEYDSDDNPKDYWNYCPKCGAEMNEKENEK